MKNLFKKILAIGLAASMTLGMAVTSFAEGEVADGGDGTNVTEPVEPGDVEPGDENTDPETPAEPEAPAAEYDAEVWVNGKDVKAKGDVKEDLNKTAVIALADLLAEDTAEDEKPAETTSSTEATEAPAQSEEEPAQSEEEPAAQAEAAESGSETEGDETPATTPSTGSTTTPPEEEVKVQIGLSKELPEKTKYIFSVLEASEENTIEKAFDAKFKGAKSKKASVKFDKKTASFKVTAGKEAGAVEVWIAEYNSKSKAITAYTSFDVIVKTAPKKFTVEIPATEDAEAVAKKATVNVKDEITLAVNTGEEVVSEDTTYTWTVKAPKTVTDETAKDFYTLTANGKTATFATKATTSATKVDKYTITCVNDQSQKKATFTVTVTNDLTTVTLAAVAMDSAAEAKIVKELTWGTDYTATGVVDAEAYGTTDKIKLFVSKEIDTEDAKTWEIDTSKKAPKFKLTGEKSKALTAKFGKDGKITLTAKKGTEAGTQAQVIMVVTHNDKSIEVYTMVVTMGAKADETPVEPEEPQCNCEPVEGVHQEGCPLYVAPEEPEEPQCNCEPVEGVHQEGCPLYVAPEATE